MAAMKVRADVAELLRAGATHRQIRAQLNVSNSTITHTREALQIPYSTPPHSKLTDDQRAAWHEQRWPRVAELLRAGATYRQVMDETNATREVITRVRQVLGIPVPEGRRGRWPAHSSISEALANHTKPIADGHAHWDGPFNGSRATLWHQGHQHQVRRETFRAHHGRAAEGRVRVDCEDPACIAGAHLTDDTLRAARAEDAHVDALYDAIFTTTGGTP
ncbi:hypothetical protein ACIQVK_25370 [Streptomyces sp. NPDC090493]|uniref:hypothetical protein n=1 Tax=Streptomyces sp. NPDC090493 TaxID=3365964 RepID=UPI0038254FB3